jgi:hypothetical protein
MQKVPGEKVRGNSLVFVYVRLAKRACWQTSVKQTRL